MNGRYFGGQQVVAYQLKKKEKYRKSKNEESTLESYEAWLDAQEDEL
jgi:hypothetical protein